MSVSGDPSDGSYTISWMSGPTYRKYYRPIGGYGYDHYELMERVGGGPWSVLSEWDVSSVSFTAKAPGAYEYKLVWRVLSCWTAETTVHDPYVHNGVEERVAVTVPAPPPPVPPTPGTITGDDTSDTGSYTLSWGTSDGADTYTLEERAGSGAWSAVHSGAANSADISGKSDGTYGYRANACNASGCSGWTGTKTVTVSIPPTPPPVPAPLTVSSTASGTGEYTVSWGDSPGATAYELQERRDGGPWQTVYTGSLRSASIATDINGAYAYRARACAGTACGGWTAAWTVTVTLPPRPPPAPGPITGPDRNSDGAYTIAWGSSTGATRYELQQSLNGGPWTVVPTTGTSATEGFTTQAGGEYHYRVRACNTAGCGDWSAIKMVLVSRPPAVGFDGAHVARTGDLGTDGDIDIYLSPLATGTGNVGEFILRNDGGAFVLDNAPTVADLASAQSWGVSTSLEVVLEDVNVDGVRDAFVTGVSGAGGFGGAVDRIVVAPAAAGARPTGLVAVDGGLKSFVNSVMA